MADVKLKELVINECSSVPSTFEPNQLYLTPDTTEEDIANALKQAKEYTDSREQDVRTDFMESDTALQTQITGLSDALDDEKGKIVAIESKIPETASSSNLLTTATDLLNATQNVRSDFADADSELQTQITGLSGTVAENKSDITNLKSQKYGSSLSYSDNNLQLLDQDGKPIGSAVEIKASGGGRNVGDIFYTTRTDTELNGAVECNGATFNTSDFSGSESIGNLLSGGKVPYVSLEEYQTAIDTNGSCRAFGWDGGDSFRVPTIPALLLMKEQASVVGTGSEIYLTQTAGTKEETPIYIAGATGRDNLVVGEIHNVNQNAALTSDPTKSGIVANLYTVQYRAMVQLANEATDEALITATRVIQDMANLKDASNFTADGKETIVALGIPDYDSGVSLTSGTVYTASCDGIVRASGNGTNNTTQIYCPDDSTTLATAQSNGYFTIWAVVKKGMKYKATGNQHCEFFPLKGVNNA